jgi:hypothetical protein
MKICAHHMRIVKKGKMFAFNQLSNFFFILEWTRTHEKVYHTMKLRYIPVLWVYTKYTKKKLLSKYLMKRVSATDSDYWADIHTLASSTFIIVWESSCRVDEWIHFIYIIFLWGRSMRLRSKFSLSLEIGHDKTTTHSNSLSYSFTHSLILVFSFFCV